MAWPLVGGYEGVSAGEHGVEFGYETMKVVSIPLGHAKRLGV